MAVEYAAGMVKRRAAEDFTGKKYYGIKFDTSGGIVTAGAGDAVGVLIEERELNQNVTIVYSGETKMVAGEPIIEGAYVSTGADGRAVTAASGKALALALSGAGAAGEYFSAVIIHGFAG